VLVQTNYGGDLRINGAPVGRELRETRNAQRETGDGSIIMVVATDAPLDHLRLERLARRALTGLARTGSSMSNGSGDYVIAFSTRRVSLTAQPLNRLTDSVEIVRNDAMSGLFQATIDATEEAIYNSLLRAMTIRGYRGVVPALPIDSTVQVLKRYGVIPQ
jgi:D-aminopeptidase